MQMLIKCDDAMRYSLSDSPLFLFFLLFQNGITLYRLTCIICMTIAIITVRRASEIHGGYAMNLHFLSFPLTYNYRPRN